MCNYELGRSIRLRFLHLRNFYNSNEFRWNFCKENNCGFYKFLQYKRLINIMLKRMDELTNWIECVFFYSEERNMVKYKGIDSKGNLLTEEEKLDYLSDISRNKSLLTQESLDLLKYIDVQLRKQEIVAKIKGYKVEVSEREEDTISREEFKYIISKKSLDNPLKDACPIWYEKMRNKYCVV